MPFAIRFGFAAVVLQLLVFLLLLAGAAREPYLVLSGLAAAIVLLYKVPLHVRRPDVPWWVIAIVALFGTVYIVNALAPEIQADANAYHLTHAIEASRTGAFSQEITFYNRLPHATESLFVFAYSLGGVPAAKLTHLAFLFLTLPLIILIGREFGIPGRIGALAAAMYFVTPVAGVSGSSAFNDAALVFYILATVWTVLRLRDSPSTSTAVLMGLFAGMCYAVKMNGGVAVVAGGLFLIATRRWRCILPFSIAVAIVISPWLLRNLIETGNPLAPFYNALFPNEYFYIEPEQQLTRALRSYGIVFGVRFTEVIAGWRLHGAIGPAFLLTPLALIATRRPAGRTLWLLALVFSAGWWMNAGSRFLLPAVPFIALAMVLAFPKPLAAGLLCTHALLSWPWIIPSYSPRMWRITEFPWRAALHIESPETYLTRTSWDYRLTQVVQRNAPPDARIFDLAGLHRAHLDRRIAGPWQSAEGHRLLSGLEFARVDRANALDEWRARFDERSIAAVRLRQQSHTARNWSVNELMLMHNGTRLKNRNRWLLTASANPWEAPFAFDWNGVSRWSTWRQATGTEFFSIDFAGSETLDEIRIISPASEADALPGVGVLNPDGTWETLHAKRGAAIPIRRRVEAMRLMKRAGITHIVAPASQAGIGVLGDSFANESEDWGLEVVTNFDAVYLFRIR